MATNQETRLKKAHVALLKHAETALYSGVILMGKSSVEDRKFTAYTNGVDKKYSRDFLEKLTDTLVRCGSALNSLVNLCICFNAT